MKKLLFTFLVASLLILLFVPSVWNWFADFWTNSSEDTSQLVVKSVSGDYSVYIDNRKVGEVKDGDSKLFPKLSPGQKSIKLIRASKLPDLYFVLEKKISFLSSTQVEIEWAAGPTLESSEGIVKYFEKISKSNGAELNIVTFPSSATVTMNEAPIIKNVDIIKTEVAKLKITDADPIYNSKEIEIKLVDADTKEVPQNIRLNIEVYLYKKPID